MFGEHTRQIESTAGGMSSDQVSWHWWTSGNYGDTICNTFWPINPQKKLPYSCSDFTTGSNTIGAVSSMHPGGANVAFCDGSVRFIKETVDSWQNTQTGTNCPPAGVTYTSVTDPSLTGSPSVSPIWSIAAGAKVGIWQKLSTRNGGEVLDQSAY
jgi:prepilin-type processing-associated H-X9-DG protein